LLIRTGVVCLSRPGCQSITVMDWPVIYQQRCHTGKDPIEPQCRASRQLQSRCKVFSGGFTGAFVSWSQNCAMLTTWLASLPMRFSDKQGSTRDCSPTLRVDDRAVCRIEPAVSRLSIPLRSQNSEMVCKRFRTTRDCAALGQKRSLASSCFPAKKRECWARLQCSGARSR
jgi:hypothetical protein